MPGPFPGYDPFLENYWFDVHTRLIPLISEQLNERLPDGLRCWAEGRISRNPSYEGRHHYPDGSIARRPLSGRVPKGPPVAVLENTETFVFDYPAATDRRVVIHDRDQNELVCTVEVLSPKNKRDGRGVFRAKQRDLAGDGVCLVEVDLLRRGAWAVFPRETDVPPHYREPYRLVSVNARADRVRGTLTRVKLREPLPAVPVFLRYEDAPVVLELQPLIDHLWRAGGYEDTDYATEILPPFPPEDAAWIAERVRAWRETLGETAGRGEAGPTGAPAAG